MSAGFGIKRKAMMPVEFHWRSGKKERTAEIGCGQVGLFDGFRRHEIGKMMGVDAGTPGARRQEIDHAGNGGRHVVRWEARDGVDARTPADQRVPVFLSALAERGDDAHSGYGDNGSSKAVGRFHGIAFSKILRAGRIRPF